MKLEFSRKIFEKYSNIKFHGNLSSEAGRIDGQTDIMKLIVAFLNFANAPKNRQLTISFSHKYVTTGEERRSIPPPSLLKKKKNVRHLLKSLENHTILQGVILLSVRCFMRQNHLQITWFD